MYCICSVWDSLWKMAHYHIGISMTFGDDLSTPGRALTDVRVMSFVRMSMNWKWATTMGTQVMLWLMRTPILETSGLIHRVMVTKEWSSAHLIMTTMGRTHSAFTRTSLAGGPAGIKREIFLWWKSAIFGICIVTDTWLSIFPENQIASIQQ